MARRVATSIDSEPRDKGEPMRQIAVINQKGGVGKTTTAINLAAALVSLGRRVVVVDMDPQANLSLHVDRVAPPGAPSAYRVLTGSCTFEEAIFETSTPNLRVVPSNIDLSGAETELASAMGRETILGEAIDIWVRDSNVKTGSSPADYLIFDCPPSLGLLALNALATAGEVLLTVQTEFLALQGMSKLVEIVQLVRKRLNSKLVISGILPCLYDTRLRLAREVLGEIRKYFPGQVFQPIGSNVKLAEAPSFGETIFQYAPESKGAQDYRAAAIELIAQESRDPELAHLPAVNLEPEPKSKPRSKPKVVAPEPKKAPVEKVEKVAQVAQPKVIEEPQSDKPEPKLRDEILTPPKPPTVSPIQAPETSVAAPDASSTTPVTPGTPTPTTAPAAGEQEAEQRRVPPRTESKMLRAENLPPLPRDAFDNYLDSMQGF